MTNEEFIAKLREAKKLALGKYKDSYRIAYACGSVGLDWGAICTFGKGTKYDTSSSDFLQDQGNTDENVSRVFDESIKALGSKP